MSQFELKQLYSININNIYAVELKKIKMTMRSANVVE